MQSRRCAVCGRWSLNYLLVLGWFVECWRHH
jgi:hypothetical protein